MLPSVNSSTRFSVNSRSKIRTSRVARSPSSLKIFFRSNGTCSRSAIQLWLISRTLQRNYVMLHFSQNKNIFNLLDYRPGRVILDSSSSRLRRSFVTSYN